MAKVGRNIFYDSSGVQCGNSTNSYAGDCPKYPNGDHGKPFWCSGLGAGNVPSHSPFDLDVTFDPAILSLNSTFGDPDPDLGDRLDLFGFGVYISTTSPGGPGTVRLFELSLDISSTLDSFQADAFTLTSLSFIALSAGMSDFGLTVIELGGSYGDPLSADIVSRSITVESSGSPNPVPESSTMILMATGMVLMDWKRFSEN